jgi:fumarylacetoacetate (FAA) hydrolase
MKLASYKQGRDGQLMVVSRDLTRAVAAGAIAPTMQYALDNWADAAPKLQKLADQLEAGKAEGVVSFDETKCASPLPRAYQIADGSAYLNHVELVRKARGAEMPPEFLHDALMYQAVSDTTLGPRDPIPVADEASGPDFEAEVAVIVDDTPMGVDSQEALQYIRLVMLMNDVTLRNLIPNELGKGFGFFNSKPPSAFTPVAVTPDELGDAWKDGKLKRPLISIYNGQEFGQPNAGEDMNFGFGELIAHAAKTRPLAAGAIIGSGTISNYDRNAGFSCLAEIRMIEKIETGGFKTPFMKYGDTIRIEMLDDAGRSIFGTIHQEVIPYQRQSSTLTKKAAAS